MYVVYRYCHGETFSQLLLLPLLHHHWRSQDFIVGGAKLRPIQPVGRGGGGGGAVHCRPILRGGGGGGGGGAGAVRCWPILRAGGRGGGVLSAVGRFYERGGKGGAVRCRPIQLVCAVRFNKWEVRMKARGGQLQTSLYKLKSQGGPTADFTVQI